MQREILFRGKRKADGAWIVGHLVSNNYGTWIVNYCDIVGRFEYQEVIPETVGQLQYTDQRGTMYFDGDVYYHAGYGNETVSPMCELQIAVMHGNADNICNIIGNIHDKPNLKP